MEVLDWCLKSLDAVKSLWDEDKGVAFRNSEEKAQDDQRLRPTVTCNAIVAFDAYGLFSKAVLEEIRYRVSPSKVKHLFSADTTDGSWFTRLLVKSSHKNGPRQAILVNHVLHALTCVLRVVEWPEPEQEGLWTGIEDAGGTLIAAIRESMTMPANSSPGDLADGLSNNPKFSPFLLLYAQHAMMRQRELVKHLGMSRASRNDEAFSKIGAALERYFEREVDRVMAHRNLQGDSGFDAASLAFALRALVDKRPISFRRSPFFAECVRAIVSGQNADGTWPDGISAMIEGGADTLQQPSIKIALVLAETIFDPRMLVSFDSSEMKVLEETLPNLYRFAKFLTATFVPEAKSGCSGWVSDRVRWPRTSETWITSLVSRFFLQMRLAEMAVERAAILRGFAVVWPAKDLGISTRRVMWQDIGEPDSVCRPAQQVGERILEPIIREQERGAPIVLPDQNGVSLLFFGPPGSGKTFFVRKVAEVLGWPMIDLSPGNFVAQGTELIESKAHEIFGTLMKLNHVVVLFDECDELFRDRADMKAEGRNILSFVTASMLPKLQRLHDQRKVVFIVATNYLARIDTAIRRPGRFDLVLLLDRPDAKARERILSASIEDAKLLETRVVETAGLTSKEVSDYAKGDIQDRPKPGSLWDYLDWCDAHGCDELLASRLDSNERREVEERWAKVKEAQSLNAAKSEREGRRSKRRTSENG